MTDISTALENYGSGVIIRIEVNPGCKRIEFPCGFNQWRNTIECAITEPAHEGKANKAIVEVISDFFNISKTDVTIISGFHTRIKRVHLEGITDKDVINQISI